MLLGCEAATKEHNPSRVDGFVITNLPVGEGDCSILQYEDTFGIIDTGTAESYPVISSFLEKNGIQTLSFMILTHFDKDHIGGASMLLEDVHVETVYIPDYDSEKKLYPVLMNALSSHSGTTLVQHKLTFHLGDVSLSLLPTNHPEYYKGSENEDNNMSLVTMATYGQNRFLFAGDIEKARINELLESGEDLRCDWIKIPHHGRYQKSLKALLKGTSPQYAIISCGDLDEIEKKMLETLEKEEITTFDTTRHPVNTSCTEASFTVTYTE